MMKKFILVCSLLFPIGAAAEDCPHPVGWVPENLPELIFEHQVWATEILPPDPFDARRLNLCNADLSGFDFSDVNLSDAIFRKARIVGVNFDKSTLNRTIFDGAYIQDSHFDGASLARASFRNSEITNSNFTDANLEKTQFPRTKLTKVNIRRANFFRADFQSSYLTEIDFSGADLTRANLADSILDNIIWQNTLLYLTNLMTIDIGEERRDHMAEFCRSFTTARAWQYSYRREAFLCGAKKLPGKYKMQGEE